MSNVRRSECSSSLIPVANQIGPGSSANRNSARAGFRRRSFEASVAVLSFSTRYVVDSARIGNYAFFAHCMR